MAADLIRKATIFGHQHSASPGVKILVKAEAVYSNVSDCAQPPAVLGRSKCLRCVFNQGQAVAPANVLKCECPCRLAVQVRDQYRSGSRVDQ